MASTTPKNKFRGLFWFSIWRWRKWGQWRRQWRRNQWSSWRKSSVNIKSNRMSHLFKIPFSKSGGIRRNIFGHSVNGKNPAKEQNGGKFKANKNYRCLFYQFYDFTLTNLVITYWDLSIFWIKYTIYCYHQAYYEGKE